MIYEYIVTLFKVIVGVITNERLAIAALISFGVLLLWVIFSLCFSFQMRFMTGARKINEYISRHGIDGENRKGLQKLVQKMPSEFVKGFNAYEKDPHSLPSNYIKRADCLDLELNGGVFNQNKSILKSFINMIFIALLVFSFAIMSTGTTSTSTMSTEQALTGYKIAEALLVPLLFLLLSKLTYYVYTAIRQHQYNVAVEEFNDMMDNFDRASMDTYGYIPASLSIAYQHEGANAAAPKEPLKAINTREAQKEVEPEIIEPDQSEEAKEDKPEAETQAEQTAIETAEKNEGQEVSEAEEITEPPLQETESEVKVADQTVEEETALLEQEVKEDEAISEVSETEQETIAREEPMTFEEESNADETIVSDEAKPQEEDVKYVDNFKPSFVNLLDDPVKEEKKRGRGRPKKEVGGENGVIIRTDKEFEEALIRAEKLMRKNEEPLSLSQTKRIEKELKSLIDAMTEYKEKK